MYVPVTVVKLIARMEREYKLMHSSARKPYKFMCMPSYIRSFLLGFSNTISESMSSCTWLFHKQTNSPPFSVSLSITILNVLNKLFSQDIYLTLYLPIHVSLPSHSSATTIRHIPWRPRCKKAAMQKHVLIGLHEILNIVTMNKVIIVNIHVCMYIYIYIYI